MARKVYNVKTAKQTKHISGIQPSKPRPVKQNNDNKIIDNSMRKSQTSLEGYLNLSDDINMYRNIVKERIEFFQEFLDRFENVELNEDGKREIKIKEKKIKDFYKEHTIELTYEEKKQQYEDIQIEVKENQIAGYKEARLGLDHGKEALSYLDSNDGMDQSKAWKPMYFVAEHFHIVDIAANEAQFYAGYRTTNEANKKSQDTDYYKKQALQEMITSKKNNPDKSNSWHYTQIAKKIIKDPEKNENSDPEKSDNETLKYNTIKGYFTQFHQLYPHEPKDICLYKKILKEFE